MQLKDITIQEIKDDLSIRELPGSLMFPDIHLTVNCEKLASKTPYSIRVLGPAERSNCFNTVTVTVDPRFSRSDVSALGEAYDKAIFERAT